MTGPADFAKMVPGFDFLQGLMKGAGAGLPHINQWIAPTLDPAELDKRIQDLKTVQFWLEQNARLLGTTIQALEVQRMTLNTLKTMNLPLADLGAALRMAEPAPAPAQATFTPPPAPAPVAAPAAVDAPTAAPATAAPPAAVDPMQWWGALTQQFSEIAAQALKHSPLDGLGQAAGAAGAAATRSQPASSRSAKAAAVKTGAKRATKAAASKTTPGRTRSAGKKSPTAKRSRA